ncbi:MAG: polyprenyl synthetase family protein [Gammaproteobacteria bacterium]|nr:polyprenyl synthetase family protein [Gammaproteobacteria bacterium]
MNKHYQQHIEQQLKKWLPAKNAAQQSKLNEAIHYAVFNGGKRLRPTLVYLTGTTLGAGLDSLDYAAMAVELIHCYSLVHDDLPTMDDDDLRRGKPSCHKAFDEATAILAGDALQCLAFEILAYERDTPSRKLQLKMIRVLANASGSDGMVGGQAFDLASQGQSLQRDQLDQLHLHKTGALIRASVQLGAYAAGCDDSNTLNALDQFANAMGLAFQVKDDLLDIEGKTETLGKPAGTDVKSNKATYPAILGASESHQILHELKVKAFDALQLIPDRTESLEQLLDYVIERHY